MNLATHSFKTLATACIPNTSRYPHEHVWTQSMGLCLANDGTSMQFAATSRKKAVSCFISSNCFFSAQDNVHEYRSSPASSATTAQVRVEEFMFTMDTSCTSPGTPKHAKRPTKSFRWLDIFVLTTLSCYVSYLFPAVRGYATSKMSWARTISSPPLRSSRPTSSALRC